MSDHHLLAFALVAVVCGVCWGVNDVNHHHHHHHLPTNSQQRLGDLEDVQFLLWTRHNPEDDQHYNLLPGDLDNLHQSPLHPDLPTFIFFHGFNGHGKFGWILQSKTELLNLYDCNVVSVDWQTLTPSPFYPQAVDNAYRTANYTAGMIDWLQDVSGLRPSQVHITGHSLGAHTAGLTGNYVTSGTVHRVTGLDPAGPFFYDKPSDQRIDKSNAAFVDIMHSNSGDLLQACFGLYEAVGHVDFYPNGGTHQPGCVTTPEFDIDDWLDLAEDCSHMRSADLWVESLTSLPPSPTFTSWPCADWEAFLVGNCTSCGQGCLNMGFHVQQGLSGSYFLRTDSTPPYALGDIQ